MRQIFRFKISVKATPKSVVRQVVSIPYDDSVVCHVDMHVQLYYFQQASLRIMSYAVESEFIDDDQLEKEMGYVF